MRNRAGLSSALKDCEKGDALVVYSLSRLSRSIRDTLDISGKLAKVSADLVSLSEKIDTTSAAGKMVFRLLSVMAQFESDQISERVKLGMMHKKSLGGRIGMIPYGKRLDVDGETLMDDDAEQEVINAVVEYRESGLALRTIVTRLEEHGFKSRAGHPLQLTQIARIVAKG